MTESLAIKLSSLIIGYLAFQELFLNVGVMREHKVKINKYLAKLNFKASETADTSSSIYMHVLVRLLRKKSWVWNLAGSGRLSLGNFLRRGAGSGAEPA